MEKEVGDEKEELHQGMRLRQAVLELGMQVAAAALVTGIKGLRRMAEAGPLGPEAVAGVWAVAGAGPVLGVVPVAAARVKVGQGRGCRTVWG